MSYNMILEVQSDGRARDALDLYMFGLGSFTTDVFIVVEPRVANTETDLHPGSGKDEWQCWQMRLHGFLLSKRSKAQR